PWFSQKLAEPMGRWAFRAKTRAAVVFAAGRWLSGIAGMVLGGLTVYEGVRDVRLAPAYGIGMILGGSVAIASSILLLAGAALPVAIVLLLIASFITVVVGWMKPDEVQRWMDRALHFGLNRAGSFVDIEEQCSELARLRI
ncbi:hypothetical protein, partial [Stenotrophomonas maltophilia]|uniref:hypothetical protein n=1 Tax=Stenotrophomonas maltophilia TaxID=40324 RepID=UPI0039C2B844